MSVFIKYEPINENKALVSVQNFYPESLSEAILATGVLVDAVPMPEPQPHKYEVLYINPQTNELFYEYINREPTPDEELAQLKQENEQLKNSLADLWEVVLLGGVE